VLVCCVVEQSSALFAEEVARAAKRNQGARGRKSKWDPHLTGLYLYGIHVGR